MRRKSERAASKKVKTSPEKKIEKPKRGGRSKRNKHSTSENESGEERESSPVGEKEATKNVEKVDPAAVKEDSPEETQEQVWQVKTAESSGDVGEIQKLKICLTRPPSTPERPDRSPRSKRKLSRATSSSDSPSVEGVDDKKRSKHRTKRLHRESKEESEKNPDSHGEEEDPEFDIQSKQEKVNSENQNEAKADGENPVSTTNETYKSSESSNTDTHSKIEGEESTKILDADTTVVSPDVETTAVSNSETNDAAESESQQDQSDVTESQAETSSSPKQSPGRPRSISIEKSEVLEIHADDSKCESSDNEMSKSNEYSTKEESPQSPEPVQEQKVSRTEDVRERQMADKNDNIKTINDSAVVENSKITMKDTRKVSIDSDKDRSDTPEQETKPKDLERRDSTQSIQDEVHNGQAAPIHVNRKRRWGSRPAKLTTQKSITISTDVLKDIISDVKPVDFEEVIEEKKHRRVEVTEKVERPLLPKIVIDNTENVEHNRKDHVNEEKEKDKDMVKPKESHLTSNRKISIIKESDSIIARPPSPPKHKHSCILYITNLVRPFTLLQLKNLLQRTGRIVENGFWIDKIKSKCYVKFEKEE